MLPKLTIVHAPLPSPAALLVPLLTDNLAPALEALAQLVGVETAALQADFKAKTNEVLLLYPRANSGGLPAKVLLLGLGDQASPVAFRKAVRQAAFQQKAKLGERWVLDLAQFSNLHTIKVNELAALAGAGVQAALLAQYDIGKFKTEGKEVPPILAELAVVLPPAAQAAAQAPLAKATALALAQLRASDLVNLPGNHLNALQLAQAAQQAGAEAGFQVRVLHKAEIEAEGMGGLLAINQGSAIPPTFIIMEHRPANLPADAPKVGLAGKGVTFDTGGISIKPSDSMGWMKSDMGGAAAVIGAVEVAARLQLPVHLVAVVPATDNKPDGNAIEPGDIVRTCSGLTIEIEDTDAEGRVILADALGYLTKNYQLDSIIDLATLTGACIVALGYHAAGLFSSGDGLATALEQAGQRSGERVWRLPLWDDYAPQIKSDMADVKNLGGRPAGAITAAKFLERFTAKHPAWAHLDIAGTAFSDSPFASQRSGTAFGVALLAEYLLELAGPR
jgi:leucyl aminopeptidase